MTEVAAALIWDFDKFVICQRPAHKSNALLWEFVGGKLEAGETKQQALIRECREELGITVEVGDEFFDVVHQYPDILVHLTVFNARIVYGEPRLLEHNDLRWITPSEIDNYRFCPADDDILEKIKNITRCRNCWQIMEPDKLDENGRCSVCAGKNEEMLAAKKLIESGALAEYKRKLRQKNADD